MITQTTPDGAVTTTTYDEGGLLESVVVDAADGETHTVLADIDENARGQRVREVLGEDAVIRSYEYDPQTFRLTRLLSERESDSAVLQDLRYTYDVVGNIVEVQDEAEQELYFQTSVVSGDRQYVYDPLYRLISATGREHPGQQPTQLSALRRDLWSLSLEHNGGRRWYACGKAGWPHEPGKPCLPPAAALREAWDHLLEIRGK